ncbi:MAG: TonB family protein [Calditrichaeota bacterium]|nr:TonB family protein [Calditrichota bacterium]
MEGHFDSKPEQSGSLTETGADRYDHIIYIDFPKKYKRRFTDSFDARFVVIWAITFIVQVSLTYYFSTHLISNPVKPEEIQKIQQQFARLVLKKEIKVEPKKKSRATPISPEQANGETKAQRGDKQGGLASEQTASSVEKNTQRASASDQQNVSGEAVRGDNPYHVPVARGRRLPNRESFKIISQNVADKGILGLLGSASEKSTGKAVKDILSEADLAQGKFKQTLDDVDAIHRGQSASEELAQRDQRVRRKNRADEEADLGNLIARRERVASANVSRQQNLEKRRQTAVRQKEPQLVGQRNPDDISAIVSKHNAAIQACYQRELRRNPDLKGKIVVRFTISVNGNVTQVELISSTLNNERVERCVLSRIRRWDDFGAIDRTLGETTFRQIYTFGY